MTSYQTLIHPFNCFPRFPLAPFVDFLYHKLIFSYTFLSLWFACHNDDGSYEVGPKRWQGCVKHGSVLVVLTCLYK